MDTTHTFTVTQGEAAQRIDLFLAAKLPGVSRSRIKALLEEGKASVNGRGVKAPHKLKELDSVALSVPAPAEAAPEPEDLSIEILYEDNDIIVVNKPSGMAVHPGAGLSRGTLVNALLFHTRDLAPTGGPLRPGIVHRLDKDTTGILVVAKNDRSYHALVRQFKERTASRMYLALVWGSVKKEEGSIDLAIGRDSVHRKKISTRARHKRQARTNYRVLKRLPLMTLLELRLETGRTHQIRVHLAELNHPVVGDQVYGRRSIPPALPKRAADRLKGIKRQMLHAYTLGITHPADGRALEWATPMPGDMAALVAALEAAE